MCGFTGIWNFNGEPINVAQLVAMNITIRHRGPDDEGYLLVNTAQHKTCHCYGKETIPQIMENSVNVYDGEPSDLAIGFRRLSIIDLSAMGHQPMQDDSGRFWIALNGEIYNYIEIRAELLQAGYSFRSQSDTEVVLYAYIHWGKDCLARFNGMWAFVIYDALENKLFGARDRFGIKPFYYHYVPGKRFIFASEIKAILQMVEPVADPQSILELFTTSYMDHSHHTFFNGITQLKPSHFLEISGEAINSDYYYHLNVQETRMDFDSAREQFLHILKDAVKIRMRSDVPLGFALSGGVDSSSIIALARNLYPSYNINAFSLVFPGKSIDESFYIQKVIEKLSVKQSAVSPSPDDLLSSIDRFIWYQEEPNNGSSYWGEFKLRELIKKSGVTVSMEGQGADEIITGYPYFIDPFLFDLLDKFQISSFFREAGAFRYLNNKSVPAYLKAYIRSGLKNQDYILLHNLPSYLNKEYFSRCILSNDTIPAEFKKSRLNKVLHHALTISSVPAQLIKADKSAMAFSVECRFPFLDYRLVELAFSLPGNFKLHQGTTKYILRESVRGLIPDEVYLRKDKVGFATPQREWLNSDLKPWIKEIVYSSSFAALPFINHTIVRNSIEENTNHIPDYRWWTLLMCHGWIQKFNISIK
jgi:asparagine synthase (glutamine-hydrolysing)